LYRLAGFEIRLPPLRERRADIGPLLVHFLERSLSATGELHRLEEQRSASSPRLWFPASLAARMIQEEWPGNVRQLANAVHRLVVEHRGSDEIPDRSERSPAPEAPPAGDLREQLRIFEVNLIRDALRRCGNSKPKAAAELNIPYRTLAHKIKTLGIEED
jgi:two-component system nitrogen regulation response regulator GlnG